jgi:ketosteroid isomerase-like protein
MPITLEAVRQIFSKLERGDGSAFFNHVADDVDWTVMGTHPLAGRYRSKAAFRAATFEKLDNVLTDGVQLRIVQILVAEDWAVVELRSEAVAKNGMRFDNRYCWLTRFVGPTIVEVRAYLDSAMIVRLFAENSVAA